MYRDILNSSIFGGRNWNVSSFKIMSHLSHVLRKHVYAICEQQRRRSACASAVANPKDRFSRDVAHLALYFTLAGKGLK